MLNIKVISLPKTTVFNNKKHTD